ncbi:MAG: serine--tRNA ligase [Legionellales bacterium RIFCSPHIGHO2_12_FULL_35_11]|nr:MAG: serine--tRNA ligase [Legionellales bacterium RIFCSPHIGHO2_12_FULL_35_11]
MLDIKYILENTETVRASIKNRNVKADLDKLLDLYTERKSKLLDLENLRAKANQIAKEIPSAPKDQKPNLIADGKALNSQISECENELRGIDEPYNEALLSIPNKLADDTPLGVDDTENVVIKKYLTPREFSFTPKDHVQLGKDLNIIDFDTGAKVAGSKFYFLKNDAVILELSLKLFALKVARENGYTCLITPDVAKKSVFTGAGFSPRGEESNIYNLEDLDLSLIATAEIPVAGMHANEIINEHDLPCKYVAESHCFRREAGSAGRENKGLYRVHQFSKIELFQITKPEDGDKALEEILSLEESIYQKLQIPYRIVRICAGDLGAAAYKKYDIEAWMPGRDSEEKYGEITSASNCTDFQSRRLNIRYKNSDKKSIYPYTLNGTAIALSRTLIAILENYQQEDGSIEIPEVLREYMGKDYIGLTH